MNITKQNNISFSSKIIIIPRKEFKKVCLYLIEQNKTFENISNFDIVPQLPINLKNIKKIDNSGFRKNVELGITEEIKNCTAGICTKENQNAPFFWHIDSTSRNVKNLPLLTKNLSGDSAIVVGSKDKVINSTFVFNKIVEDLKNKNIPTTIMQGLSSWWETHLAYLAKEDTLYMSVNDIRTPSICVNSFKDLKKIFDKVEISPNDKLIFSKKILTNPEKKNFFSQLFNR